MVPDRDPAEAEVLDPPPEGPELVGRGVLQAGVHADTRSSRGTVHAGRARCGGGRPGPDGRGGLTAQGTGGDTLAHAQSRAPQGDRARVRDLRLTRRPCPPPHHGLHRPAHRLGRRAVRPAGGRRALRHPLRQPRLRPVDLPRRRRGRPDGGDQRRAVASSRCPRCRTRCRTWPWTPWACSTTCASPGPTSMGASMGGMIAQTDGHRAPGAGRVAHLDHVDDGRAGVRRADARGDGRPDVDAARRSRRRHPPGRGHRGLLLEALLRPRPGGGADRPGVRPPLLPRGRAPVSWPRSTRRERGRRAARR